MNNRSLLKSFYGQLSGSVGVGYLKSRFIAVAGLWLATLSQWGFRVFFVGFPLRSSEAFAVRWNEWSCRTTAALGCVVALWGFLAGNGFCEIREMTQTVQAEGHLGTYEQHSQQDFSIRSRGTLKIVNSAGDIVLHGWALDKVRVKITKITQTHSVEQAQKNFAQLSHRYLETDLGVELSSQYGQTLSIPERLGEQVLKSTHLNMVVYAPWNLVAQIWVTRGMAQVRRWNSDVSVRSSTGKIQVSEVIGAQILANCAHCNVLVSHSKADLKCFGGSGTIDIDHLVSTGSVYVESGTGAVSLKNVTGEQVYLSRAGAISGVHLKGAIEFHTQSANIDLKDIVGVVTGATQAGDVALNVTHWETSRAFEGMAVIESKQGSIDLILPKRFSGDVLFRSITGSVATNFEVEDSRVNQQRHQGRAIASGLGSSKRRIGDQVRGQINLGGRGLAVVGGAEVAVGFSLD